MRKTVSSRIAKNTIALVIFNVAKIVFPFVTLPYLTRVFDTDTYGVTAYTKTIMNYMQIFVDFGFVLSGTKNIVQALKNKESTDKIIGDTLLARVILGLVGFLIVLLLSAILPMLRENLLFVILSYFAIFESVFLMDFLFRGMEIMHIITIRFVIMKIISTALTFIFIKDPSDMMLIPIFDIMSSFVAIMLVFYEMKKRKIKMKFSGIKNAILPIRESFVYFLSNAAAISFTAVSTVLLGLQLDATQVAYWSVCMQVIGTVQACYSPISDGIYPEMVRNKNLRLIKKILVYFTPVVMLICIAAYFLAGWGLRILGGIQYLEAVPIFRILIPSMLFGFWAIILGWPTLGAIDKSREVTFSTVFSVSVNILALVILILTDNFTIINVAIVRMLADLLLFAVRLFFVIQNKENFRIS